MEKKVHRSQISFQTLYCGLRDWKELPCPDLEQWLRSNILPLDPRFSKSLDQLPRPQTILDDSSVQAWFERTKTLDASYCSELKAIILSRSLGVGAESPLPKWIRVSSTLPISYSLFILCGPLDSDSVFYRLYLMLLQ